MAAVTGIQRSADFASNGAYRLVLRRWWDSRPRLLAAMFNPSEADARRDDPTVALLIQIAAHHGYGGLTVVNGIPLVSSEPSAAAWMVNTWDKRQAWDERDALQMNLSEVRKQVAEHRDVLLAWGALASRCPDWFDHVEEQIREALPEHARLLCLGRTSQGYPLHPLARGKMKVRRDAPLLPWRD